MDPLGGLAEMKLLRGGDEVLELPEFHGSPSRCEASVGFMFPLLHFNIPGVFIIGQGALHKVKRGLIDFLYQTTIEFVLDAFRAGDHVAIHTRNPGRNKILSSVQGPCAFRFGPESRPGTLLLDWSAPRTHPRRPQLERKYRLTGDTVHGCTT